MRILIVEDEKGIAEVFREALERKGFECRVAHDVEQAATRLKDEEFDLVTLDHMLPGMRGLDWLRREVVDRPGLLRRILIVSGSPIPQVHKDWLRRNSIPILNKPMELKLLVSTIQQMLQN